MFLEVIKEGIRYLTVWGGGARLIVEEVHDIKPLPQDNPGGSSLYVGMSQVEEVGQMIWREFIICPPRPPPQIIIEAFHSLSRAGEMGER